MYAYTGISMHMCLHTYIQHIYMMCGCARVVGWVNVHSICRPGQTHTYTHEHNVSNTFKSLHMCLYDCVQMHLHTCMCVSLYTWKATPESCAYVSIGTHIGICFCIQPTHLCVYMHTCANMSKGCVCYKHKCFCLFMHVHTYVHTCFPGAFMCLSCPHTKVALEEKREENT